MGKPYGSKMYTVQFDEWNGDIFPLIVYTLAKGGKVVDTTNGIVQTIVSGKALKAGSADETEDAFVWCCVNQIGLVERLGKMVGDQHVVDQGFFHCAERWGQKCLAVFDLGRVGPEGWQDALCVAAKQDAADFVRALAPSVDFAHPRIVEAIEAAMESCGTHALPVLLEHTVWSEETQKRVVGKALETLLEAGSVAALEAVAKHVSLATMEETEEFSYLNATEMDMARNVAVEQQRGLLAQAVGSETAPRKRAPLKL